MINKTLNCGNEAVLIYSTIIISYILYGIGELEGERKPNPVREEVLISGMLNKLINIFHKF